MCPSIRPFYVSVSTGLSSLSLWSLCQLDIISCSFLTDIWCLADSIRECAVIFFPITSCLIRLFFFSFLFCLLGLQELEGKTISTGNKILPFPPGHVDTYQLLANGKTAFEERARFHKIGQTPMYKTVITAKGMRRSLRRLWHFRLHIHS